MGAFCEHGNESFAFIASEGFLACWVTTNFSRQMLFSVVS